MCLSGLNMGEPPVVCTPLAEKLRTRLKIIMWSHIVVSIIKMIVYGFVYGLGDLLSCAILYCGIS